VLGAVFLVASIDKILDTNGFITSILNYKVIGSTFATLTATFLPWLELFCGVCLILGIYPRASSILISIMLFAFTILVASALIRGLDISCGCFSQDPSAEKIGYQKIAENLILLALGLYLIVTKDYGPSVSNFMLGSITTEYY